MRRTIIKHSTSRQHEAMKKAEGQKRSREEQRSRDEKVKEKAEKIILISCENILIVVVGWVEETICTLCDAEERQK